MTANYSNKNSLIYPSGTTAARPTSVNNGFIYFNTTIGALQIYQNGSWYVLTNINAPGAPTSVSATDLGTGRAYNNGLMSVSFTPTSETVGFPATYTVTPTPSTSPTTFSSTSSPIQVSGLTSSTQYTYTVTASNNTGTSSASSASSGVTATTVPQAPSLSATAGDTQATITITPGATGGSAITQYTIISNPVTTTQTTSNVTYNFTGLTNDTAYTFTATATNANGTSASSSPSNSITPALPDTGNMFPIRSYIVPSGGAASITFSSIPSTYTHLQLRIMAGSARAASSYSQARIEFNSDSSSSYSSHSLFGNGSTVTSDAQTTQTSLYNFYYPNGSKTYYGVAIIDILDYANTSKYKTVRTLTGVDDNNASSAGVVGINSGLWQSTSAITSIVIKEGTFTNNFLQYSSFALYGVLA